MRIYLDNCCFNRPFDNQSSIRVKIETDAKLYVQLMIKTGKIELAWSYILDYENDANPSVERRDTIGKWKFLASIDIVESEIVLDRANNFASNGLKAKDSLHLACAIETKCDYFLTTDDFIQKRAKGISDIEIVNPTEFIKLIEEL